MTSKKKSKVKEQEAAIQAAQRAAEADAAASVTVKIYSVNETGASISLECSQVDLVGQRPVGLHGGALLGVATSRHIKSGAEGFPKQAAAVGLYHSCLHVHFTISACWCNGCSFKLYLKGSGVDLRNCCLLQHFTNEPNIEEPSCLLSILVHWCRCSSIGSPLPLALRRRQWQ